MYKRQPVGDYHVGVCTNTLCAVMGGDAIFERLKDHLDVGNDETTADGKVTLEHVECNAACDYAPVMMVNWEFMDNMTPTSAVELVDDLRAGKEVTPPAGRGSAPGARPSGCSPASPTAASTRARRPDRPRWSASSIAREQRLDRPGGRPRHATAGGADADQSETGEARRRAGGDRAAGGRDRGRRASRRAPSTEDKAAAETHGSSATRGRGHDRHPDPGPHRHLGRRARLDAGAYERARRLRRPRRRRWRWTPEAIVEAVKESGLRGRGGAGFPTGMKWSFIPQDNPKPKYLVVNADESEPGTCKDIPLMMANPHVLVEGVIISSFAIRANTAFIYIRGEVAARHPPGAGAPSREAYAAGHLGKDIHGSGYDLDLVVHAGAGAYICGEETALLDGLEGRRGQPRLRPPFPAVAGLYASPTVINNVESIASVPSIIEHGAEWFASMGTEKSKGYGIFSLSGHVTQPGQYEAPLGITLRELIDLAGGMREGHELKFWTPGGSSTPLLTAEHLDVPLGFEDVGAAGSMLGTRALQLFDETTCVVRAVLRWTEFYKHESCGKCTPVPRGHLVAGADPGRARAGRGQRGRPRPAARPVRQHPRPLVLRARRRRRQPDLELDRVLPRRVPRAPRHGGCPFDPARLDALRRRARSRA